MAGKKGTVNEFFDLKELERQKEAAKKSLQEVISLIETTANKASMVGGNFKGGKTPSDTKKATEELNLVQKEAIRLQKELDVAAAKLAVSESKLSKANIETKQALKAKQDQEKLEVAAQNALLGAYKQAEAQLKLLQNAYRNLVIEGKKSTEEAKNMKVEIDKLDKAIKQADASVGIHNKNVGNYKGAIMGVVDTYKKWALAIGGVVGALSGVIAIGKKAISGAMDDERQERKLFFAVNQNAKAYQDLLKIKEKFLATTVFNEEEIYNALNYAAAFGKTTEQMDKMLRVATALANITGVDLDTAMQQLTGTFEGTIGKLGKYASEIKGLTDDQYAAGVAVDILDEKIGRFSTVGLDTAAGNLKQFNKNWDDFLDNLGKRALPLIDKIVTGFNRLFFGAQMDRQKAAFKSLDEAMAPSLKNLKELDQSQQDAAGSLDPLIDEIIASSGATKNQAENLRNATKAWEDYMKAVHAAATMTMGETPWASAPISETQPIGGAGQISTGNAGQQGLVNPSNANPPSVGTALTPEEQTAQDVAVWTERLRVAQEFSGAISDIVNQSFENQLYQLDVLAERDREAKEKEIENAKGSKSKIDEINKKYADRDKEREKEALKMKQQQAKYNKAAGLVQAIINSALAITSAALTQPFIPLGLIAVVAAAAIGAAQVALIASQPIPQYAKGRKGGKAEFAITGERGAEGIVYKDGKGYITPPRPTLTYLPEGAEVIPNDELMELAGRASCGTLAQYPTIYDLNFGGGSKRIEEKLDLLRQTIKDKQETQLNISAWGMQRLSRNGGAWTEYLNSRVTFK